jgi:hypothetical protein
MSDYCSGIHQSRERGVFSDFDCNPAEFTQIMGLHSSYLPGILLSCVVGINAFGLGGHHAFMQPLVLRSSSTQVPYTGHGVISPLRYKTSIPSLNTVGYCNGTHQAKFLDLLLEIGRQKADFGVQNVYLGATIWSLTVMHHAHEFSKASVSLSTLLLPCS